MLLKIEGARVPKAYTWKAEVHQIVHLIDCAACAAGVPSIREGMVQKVAWLSVELGAIVMEKKSHRITYQANERHFDARRTIVKQALVQDCEQRVQNG